ncbi:glycoside hydrolase family 2 TIM barrel-domain containing protein [Seonamhaeicola maritimus]|uniref:Glycoside hydrolase family 2 catalytic domain-containing protein n=1 Tax=Seonamhaeicola maritimus TaxID=2591822 RepID=A0A5C7GHD3_9FLAO|nr:glycoside hydrolase family 2 TIM barrel-domain containing protein [Seonamhaeicola maritimus]TXG36997.1 hypothetical protein FUA22_10530 [Seonamhaeicola maritimus]
MHILNKLILALFTVTVFSCNETTNNEVVSVAERQILVNNKPYIIKGICYHPVAKGQEKRSFETLEQDLALMLEAGINTIRVYAPIDDKTVLDKIHKAKIKVVIGFGYDQGGVFDIKAGTFIDYVNKYKTHPAILMWELGNEYNYHPQWFDGDIKNWYNAMNNAAAIIHENDTNHPVTTAHGDLPDNLALSLSPNIDVWGINIYRWDKPGSIYSQWEKASLKPMYFSEAGGDSYMTIEKDGFAQGVNEDAQASANKNILVSVFDHTDICSGVTMFSFTDGWWKAGNPNQQDVGGWAPNSSGVPYDGSPNEEYWGIVDIDRNKKKTFEVIKNQYLKN